MPGKVPTGCGGMFGFPNLSSMWVTPSGCVALLSKVALEPQSFRRVPPRKPTIGDD